MTTELKQTLEFYQKGLITKDEFKRLVNCVADVKECESCKEEFVTEKDDRFCQECQKDFYAPTNEIENQEDKWGEEKESDEIEQEERHAPLDNAAEQVDFSEEMQAKMMEDRPTAEQVFGEDRSW